MAKIKQKEEPKIQKTSIEWALNPDGAPGYTWNPISGCLNGCPYCYARKLANSRVKSTYLANDNVTPYEDAENVSLYLSDRKLNDPFYPRFWENKLTDDKNNPLSRKKPIGVFVVNMGDLFGIGVPEDWTKQVLEHIEKCPQHRFYLLTKQPQNLVKFSPLPPNAWVGVTATDTAMYQDACVGLNEIEAKVRFISFEPLLGAIYTQILNPITPYYNPRGIPFDWVIIGALTCGGGELAELSYLYPELTPRPYGNRYTLQPKIEWVQEIVEAADKAGIPVFLKDNLFKLLMTVPHSDLFWENMSHLRQELPDDK